RIVCAYAVFEEGAADSGVPAVELVVPELPPDQRADAHLAVAVRPRPFPWVALAVLAVDLLEREEPPRDVDRHRLAHLTDPLRRLIRVRTHRVEEPLHALDIRSHEFQSGSLRRRGSRFGA